MTHNQDLDWQTQKVCADIDDYELVVEKQKTHWECEQKRESWKWSVGYHGTIVSSGSVNSIEEAKEFAIKKVPKQASN